MKSYGCAFNRTDIFRYFDTNLLKMKQKDIGMKRRDKAAQIWEDHYRMVLKDCIENGDSFELPLTNIKADIHVDRIHGEAFKNCRRAGMFQEIDFLKSNFTANRLQFTMHRKNMDCNKPIYVSRELKQKLIDNTNNGFQYC